MVNQIILVESNIVESKTNLYWADPTRSVTDQTILRKYTKGDFNIELVESIGWFQDKEDSIMRYKTIIKIFKEGVRVKRKLFWFTNDRVKNMSNEDLINEVFNLIN